MSEAARRPEMHPQFPRWYGGVDMEQARERASRRWEGIAAIVTTADEEGVEAMLRVAFRAKAPPAPAALETIKTAFKAADDFFETSGNAREMELLCGCCLAVLMEQSTDLAAYAALGVTTAGVDGARIPELPMDLTQIAEHAIAKNADERRVRPQLGVHDSTEQINATLATARAGLQQTDVAGVATTVGCVMDAVSALSQNVSDTFDKLANFTALQDEELEMLWWLFGRRSDELCQSFEDIAPNARPLILAKELAAATRFRPGPRSVEGILERAGLKPSDSLTIPDAVNSCDVTWLTLLGTGIEHSPLTQPIHFAIDRKLETRDDSSWIPGWAGACGVDASHSISSLSIGNLFYRERLLSASKDR
jgi:hypothetical protein